MSSNESRAFWICHECGAEMRPILRDGVNHCAACDGEFIEILDPTVNPDPYHELPAPPPTRPTGEEHHDPFAGGGPGPGTGNFMTSLLGNIFGAAVGDPHGQGGDQEGQVGGSSGSRPGSPGNHPPNAGGAGGGGGGGGGGGRSFAFNLPGGGRGQVMFGSFNGNMGGPGGTDMFGDDGSLASFFPGFGPPPGAGARNRLVGQGGLGGPQMNPLGPHDAMGPEEMIRSMMAALSADGDLPPLGGPPGRANLGDYVFSQQGFDRIMEDLMRAAGPQGPLPASDVVIEGLPKFKLTEETLEKSQFKDCPVCKEDFEVGTEVKRIPCKHLFHPDCLDPWLKVNGTCPVCRFSLIPSEENGPPRATPTGATDNSAPTPNQQPGPHEEENSYMQSILRRLWGPTGNAAPSSPTTETHPEQSNHNPLSTQSSDPVTARQQPQPPSGSAQPGQTENPPSLPTASHSGQTEEDTTLHTDIPEDYRERHRRRERERHQLPPEEDVD